MYLAIAAVTKNPRTSHCPIRQLSKKDCSLVIPTLLLFQSVCPSGAAVERGARLVAGHEPIGRTVRGPTP